MINKSELSHCTLDPTICSEALSLLEYCDEIHSSKFLPDQIACTVKIIRQQLCNINERLQGMELQLPDEEEIAE